MFNCLELFSGTGSFGKVAKSLGYDVISLDLLLSADIQEDILTWDYKIYKPDHFDIVWASPPCTAYSHLQNGWLGRKRKGVIFTHEIWAEEMKESDKIVLKTIEILNYFNPLIWFIENPAGSKLKERPFMKQLENDNNCYIVDYCKYSDWGYKKRTRIWTNKDNWTPLICKNDCENMVIIQTNGAVHTGSKKPIKSSTRLLHKNNCGDIPKQKEIKRQLRLLHKNNCGNSEKLKAVKDNTEFDNGTTQLDRYRIPPLLIFSLLQE